MKQFIRLNEMSILFEYMCVYILKRKKKEFTFIQRDQCGNKNNINIEAKFYLSYKISKNIALQAFLYFYFVNF